MVHLGLQFQLPLQLGVGHLLSSGQGDDCGIDAWNFQTAFNGKQDVFSCSSSSSCLLVDGIVAAGAAMCYHKMEAVYGAY